MAKNIFRGTTEVSNIYRGTTLLDKVYRGQTEIWSTGPAILPPHSPSFYYDATNTDYSSTTSWDDIVSEGDTDFSFAGTRNNYPDYTSGEYYDFDQNTDSMYANNSSTTDDLSFLAGTSHTLFALARFGSVNEEDLLCNTTNGNSVLLMVYANRVRGHVWYNNSILTTDSTIHTLAANTWYVVGQRATYAAGVTNGTRVDAFVCYADKTLTITNGTAGTRTAGSSASSQLNINARGTSGHRGDYDLTNIGIYRTALSDSEIQDVCDYMIDKIPT